MLRESRDREKEQENKRTKGMGERTKKRGGNKRGKEEDRGGEECTCIYRLLDSSLFLPVTLVSNLLFTRHKGHRIQHV